MRWLLIGALLSPACTGLAAPAGLGKHLGVMIPMRDGVRLAANIFLPAGAGHCPAILVRTPYNKGADITPNYQAFVERGYAVVVQDVRGRFASEGIFDPLRQELADGSDTITWIARQPWSNGRVGMMGGSYLGIVQWKAALMNNPHLKAIFPAVSGCDDYRDRFYSSGGAMKLGQRLLWMSANMRAAGFRPPEFLHFVSHLPLRSADREATGQKIDMYRQALRHPDYDAFWKSISTREQFESIRVPVFSVGGWFDNFVQSDLEAFQAMRKLGRVHRILIGPWPHNVGYTFPGVDFGPEARVALRSLQLEWFDHWLKGPDTARDPPARLRPAARIFVMGANRWREEDQWPPAAAYYRAFYLASQGRANSLNGDGQLVSRPRRQQPADQFVYDPRKTVPTSGGAVCCNPKVFPWGPLDQRPVERRQDVLVYTTPPLRRDLEVTGPVRVVLFVSTSAPDTDFTAKLVDVYPDGQARGLTDGILRLRYRESIEKAVLAKPGETYKITIDAGLTANLFRKGHRIRVEISSSNFPRFDRNPNTGRSIADEVELRPATQTVYHDRVRSSHLLLPVLP